MFKKLVNDYMRDQWANCRRDIGFHAAKEELLSSARIMFCEPGTTAPKYVFKDEELSLPFPLPVMADSNGEFPRMYLGGDYSLTVTRKDGVHLAMVTTRPGFDIEA